MECTFLEPSPRRSPPKAYITDLEKRVQSLEALIRRVAPTIDIDKEVGPSFNLHTWEATRRGALSSETPRLAASKSATAPPDSHDLPHVKRPISHSIMPSITSSNTATRKPTCSFTGQGDPDSSDNEKPFASRDGAVTKHLGTMMEKLGLGEGMEKKFHGKVASSAGINLVQAALALKEEVTGVPSIWDRCHITTNSRPKFSQPSPWEWVSSPLLDIGSLRFPPPDLIRTLVDHFFDDFTPLLPLLHRSSFERQYAEGQHRHDLDFARLLLIVCSIGGRYSNDARVCLTSPAGEIEWSSAGWMYFAQVYQSIKPMPASCKLVDLQIMALMTNYLQGTSSSKGAWLINGIGLRLAVDMGCHRHKVYAPEQAFHNQLWKRVFWCLLVTDKILSAILGRPMCISDDDVDAHLPLEVDDDGWDQTLQIWLQPADKPSQLAYFTNYAKLLDILSRTMRTVYSISKSKVHLGWVGPDWEQNTVAELDSALNAWVDAVPDHLRWDPDVTSESPFFRQVAALRVAFCYVQITIHRPFVQLSSASKRALSLSSLAICANAARSCARILNATVEMTFPTMFSMMAFISGLILLISIWEARRSGLNVDVSQQVKDVQTCLTYLKRQEHRYYICGRLYDILRETAFVSDIPIPEPQQNTLLATINQKHRADAEHQVDTEQPRAISDDAHANSTFNGTNRSSDGLLSISSSTSQSTPTSSQYIFQPHGMSGTSDVNGANHATHAPIAFEELQAFMTSGPLAPQYRCSSLSAAPLVQANSTNPLMTFSSNWESHHMTGSDLGFQGFPGYNVQAVNGAMDPMAPDDFWHELMGPLIRSEEGTGDHLHGDANGDI
ncbi:hypothetical protein FRB98_009394 [Tulasnella sp. 332]|nr:hypothetical protein FRB98_009394 [Tulasnella sp. 332]